jgi:undecaprenyl-phosphate galactose phosphotransferase/putative colanic acid biosynthesis UDP-glucose lipid carrier transferase
MIGLYLRFGYSPKFFRIEYILFYLLSNFVWIALFQFFNQSIENKRIDVGVVFKGFLKQWLINLLLILAFVTIIKGHFYSRWFLFYDHSILLILGAFIRVAIWKIFRIKGINFKRIVVIGANKFSQSFVREINNHPEYGYKFLGYFDFDKNKKSKNRNIYNYKEIYDFLVDKKINEIYISNSEYNDEFDALFKFCQYNNIQIKIINKFMEKLNQKNIFLKPDYNGLTPIFDVHDKTSEIKAFFVVKRLFDITFSVIFFMTLGWWLFPIVALLIKLESKGPVFFLQKRSGLNNSVFNIVKFRTMYVNNDADTKQAEKNDSRITRIGKFLRDSNIDELPQIINVLMGQMSFVGPRPHMLAHTDYYSSKIKKYHERLWFKPGITGLAQSKGFIGETKQLIQMENRVIYDRLYVYNWDFLLDMKILVMTTVNMMSKHQYAA